MINRISIIFHVFLIFVLTSTVFAANPILSHKAGIAFDRLIFVFIEALYRLKDLA